LAALLPAGWPLSEPDRTRRRPSAC